jgi:S-adenosylmethionine-dependent methyltransferase
VDEKVGDMSSGQPVPPSVGQRRSAARTAVVWAALDAALRGRDASRLRVLDVGGGTGGFAVRVAELGADVTVVDPSPDALAALDRRADEQGVAARVRGQQGDLATLRDLVAPASVDVVLCHGVLEVVEDPGAALEALAAVLPPNGLLSLVVAQQHAAVVARAMAGHLQQAREILLGAPPPGPRRFTHDEVAGLVAAAGFGIDTVHAVRVFADLVPSSLLDLEPGAADALVALEESVADRPEFLPLAQQLHVLATRS